VAELLRGGRPLLLDLGADPGIRAAAAGWTDRVDVMAGRCADAPAPALLVRPDGYVAWAGAPEPAQALRTWFGAPSAPAPARPYATARGER
jgi:hypothetical protein